MFMEHYHNVERKCSEINILEIMLFVFDEPLNTVRITFK